MITGTMESLEACKICNTWGRVKMGQHTLACETCDGSGIMWVERGTVSLRVQAKLELLTLDLLTGNHQDDPVSNVKGKRDMIRTKIAAGLGALALGTLALAGGASAAYAGPPPPLTERTIVSASGAANYLDSCQATGDQEGFAHSPSGCYGSEWFFQIQSNGLYEIHDSIGDCLTLSTTQTGVIKDEGCVQAGNQEFQDINTGGIYGYIIYNQYLAKYLNDPHWASGAQHVAGTISSCSTGQENCNFAQH